VAALRPNPGLLPGAAVNSLVYLLGIKVLLRGLTPMGVAHSWVLGASVYAAFGFSGYLLVCLYFVAGSAVTKIKIAEKEAEGIAEARSGRRSPWSVWGSGIAALGCAAAALATGEYDFWQIGFVASVASKLSDTVSSELGKAYGRTTFLATTFKVVPRGTEGAVSLEGTAAGAAAAVAFSGLALAFGQVNPQGCFICIAAALVANYFESFLGASVQGGVPWLTNDVVNMIQITLAAALALGAQAAMLQL